MHCLPWRFNLFNDNSKIREDTICLGKKLRFVGSSTDKYSKLKFKDQNLTDMDFKSLSVLFLIVSELELPQIFYR